MDFQAIVDGVETMASILSFDRLPDGSFSEIRMMAMNKVFAGIAYSNPETPPFQPGMPYRYFFQDVNFENYCYKCASTHDTLYSYTNARGVWLKGMYIPIVSDRENTFYCCYILTFTQDPEAEHMSNHSAEVSSAVLNLSIKLHKTQNFMQSMKETIGDIAKICGSGRCSIVLVNKHDQSCTLINERGEDPAMLERISVDMECTTFEVALAWEKILDTSDCLILDDLSLIKERNPAWYRSLCSFHIESIVLFAIRFNQELVGFIWASNYNSEGMMRIKETFELATFFLGAFIANHQLLDKFEIMSMTDMLTQVKNRNAMNKRVDQLMEGSGDIPKSMGVIFADLNGLKTVNDRDGHAAGDRVLKKASSLLKTVFGENEIYRAGGDEFVVFCPEMTENEMDSHIKEFKALLDSTQDVSFAIGSAYVSGPFDICHTMQTADERMYLDKEEYYRLHKEKYHREKE